jgi:hypothetical protein
MQNNENGVNASLTGALRLVLGDNQIQGVSKVTTGHSAPDRQRCGLESLSNAGAPIVLGVGSQILALTLVQRVLLRAAEVAQKA